MNPYFYQAMTVWMGAVLGLTSLLVCPLAADAQSSERPWLARGNDLAKLTWKIDAWRGFHEEVVEIGTLDARGRWTLRRRQPVLPPATTRWLRHHGEYDLYRRDLTTARNRMRRSLLSRGFKPMRLIPVELPLAAHLTPYYTKVSMSPGYIRFKRARLVVRVSNYRGRAWVSLTNPKRGTRYQFTVPHLRAGADELSHGRRNGRGNHRVSGLWLSEDGRWATFTVDTAVSLHAEFVPSRRVRTVSFKHLAQRLDIGGPFWDNGGPTT